jgi:hypothetical protein
VVVVRVRFPFAMTSANEGYLSTVEPWCSAGENSPENAVTGTTVSASHGDEYAGAYLAEHLRPTGAGFFGGLIEMKGKFERTDNGSWSCAFGAVEAFNSEGEPLSPKELKAALVEDHAPHRYSRAVNGYRVVAGKGEHSNKTVDAGVVITCSLDYRENPAEGVLTVTSEDDEVPVVLERKMKPNCVPFVSVLGVKATIISAKIESASLVKSARKS